MPPTSTPTPAVPAAPCFWSARSPHPHHLHQPDGDTHLGAGANVKRRAARQATLLDILPSSSAFRSDWFAQEPDPSRSCPARSYDRLNPGLTTGPANFPSSEKRPRSLETGGQAIWQSAWEYGPVGTKGPAAGTSRTAALRMTRRKTAVAVGDARIPRSERGSRRSSESSMLGADIPRHIPASTDRRAQRRLSLPGVRLCRRTGTPRHGAKLPSFPR
jgi:hypothetical protein